MAHLSDGTLRRLYDEPLALGERDREHYGTCAACQARFHAVAAEAREAMALLTVPAATVDAGTALTRVRNRIGAEAAPAGPMARLRGLFSPAPVGIGWRRPAAVGVAAAGLVAAMAFTPVLGAVVQVFQPTQVSTVTVTQPTQSDMASLQQFSKWGDVKTVSQPQLTQEDSAAAAARASGLPQIKIDKAALPASLRGAPVSYAATSKGVVTVTFNANAPAQIRGSTLTLTVEPAEMAIFGDVSKAYASATGQKPGAAAPGDSATAAAGSDQTQTTHGAAAARQQLQQALSQVGPLMGVAVMPAPKVTSTGVSVAEIRTALLNTHPSSALRDLIKNFDNPTGNLPIPIPAGSNLTTESVTIHDRTNSHDPVNGTEIGDNTGLGGGVIWVQDGRVYGVAGTVAADEALTAGKALK
ncbi:MAG: hypothetical protein M3024_16230 [Candidatus Dormibacteraeota bacterium]|nr:hypothetical protein [Candidatus Dormibacteraeota bacterium]